MIKVADTLACGGRNIHHPVYMALHHLEYGVWHCTTWSQLTEADILMHCSVVVTGHRGMFGWSVQLLACEGVDTL